MIAQIALYFNDSDIDAMACIISRHKSIDPNEVMIDLMPIVKRLPRVQPEFQGIHLLQSLLALDPSAVDMYSIGVDIDDSTTFFYAIMPSAIKVYHLSEGGFSWHLVREYPL